MLETLWQRQRQRVLIVAHSPSPISISIPRLRFRVAQLGRFARAFIHHRHPHEYRRPESHVLHGGARVDVTPLDTTRRTGVRGNDCVAFPGKFSRLPIMISSSGLSSQYQGFLIKMQGTVLSSCSVEAIASTRAVPTQQVVDQRQPQPRIQKRRQLRHCSGRLAGSIQLPVSREALLQSCCM